MIVGDTLFVGVVRFGMGMRMIVDGRAVTMFMGVDDDLPGGVTTAAALAADLSCALALRAFFRFISGDLFFHSWLLSRICLRFQPAFINH
jgi:hypothetical protein